VAIKRESLCAVITLLRLKPGEGVGAPLYMGYMYVQPQRARFLNGFDLKNGYRFCLFWSRKGYAFHSGFALGILFTKNLRLNIGKFIALLESTQLEANSG